MSVRRPQLRAKTFAGPCGSVSGSMCWASSHALMRGPDRNHSSVVSELEDSIGREINYVVYERDELDRKLREGDAFLENVESGPKIMLIGREENERKQLDAR